ncbi:MAG: glycogen synthase GlgA [Candidatus Krumholzibacteriota bacterium]
MNVLMVSAEMAPFAKVGGLADVVTALAAAMAARKHDVRVVLPLYGHLDREREKIRPIAKIPPLSLRVGQEMHDIRFHMRGSPRAAVKVYLVECPALYDRAGVYADEDGKTFDDALARAALHGQAALLLARLLDWPVDVVHAHDAEAAPAILYRRHWYGGRPLPGPAGTLLTIHNLAHQEIHPVAGADTLGLPRSMASYPGLLEFHGSINLLKAGILAADRVNTVSPTYAEETTTDPDFGCGLEGVLSGREEAYSGILNGADYTTWDPRRDKFLPANFGPADHSGKEVCRRELLGELGLKNEKSKPLCGFVGRLVRQKGLDLVLPLLDRLADDGFTFAVLGTGDKATEAAARQAAKRHPDKVAFVGSFDESLAHRIYAGSDLFLMPSVFEPCGLSQMYSLRYGTLPVVRRTGGLADTITDAAKKTGNGFVFDEASPEELLSALRTAEGLWENPGKWRLLQERGMKCDFSWKKSAIKYEKLYRAASRTKGG